MTIRRVLGYMLIIIGMVLCVIAVSQNIVMGACTPEIKIFGGVMMLIIMIASRKKVEVNA